MSIEAMVWALKQAPVTDSGEHVVLISLADHASPEGKDAYPSRATIAEYARCTVRTVAAKLKSLEDAGIIVRGDQQKVAHIRPDRRPVVYDLNYGVKILPPVDEVIEASPRIEDGVNAEVSTAGNLRYDGVNVLSHKPSLTVLEPNPLPPTESTSPAVALSREENHKRFEMFWDAFPKSRNKKETENLYAAAVRSGLSHEFLLDKAKGFARQAAQEPPERRQYIASSVTWLTDGRWKEHYPPAPTPRAKLHPLQRSVAE